MELFMLTAYDNSVAVRRGLLADASRALVRGRPKRAISIYRQIIAYDSEDVEVSLRLSQLLAADGQSFEAWSLVRASGKLLLRSRRHEQCLSIFKEATRFLPFEFEAWRITADLEMKLDREEEAYQTLLEGRRQFRSRFDRAQAIALLSLARSIVPWNHELVMDLAQLYRQTDQSTRALRLLEHLAIHSRKKELRDIRWLQWQISRAPQDLIEWLRVVFAWLSGRKETNPSDGFGEAGMPIL